MSDRKRGRMARLIFLGTANSIPDEQHENTHIAIAGESQFVLIDCAGNPLVRLSQAGLDENQLNDLILTHYHPDHVSGVPLLLMNCWLLGRRKPLHIYGLAHTLDRIKRTMQDYDWDTWPNFYPVHFHELPSHEMAPVLENVEWRIYSSPVRHLIPTIGLRIEIKATQKVVAYSSDTGPCPEVVKLGEHADILIHEATGESTGHSSAAQAGEIALQAQAKALYLIHYQTGDFNAQALVEEACSRYNGPVALAEDFLTLDL